MSFIKRNKKGIIGTIVFHVILVLMFVIAGFSTPLPLPEEETILINFGTSTEGKGRIEPKKAEELVKPVQPVNNNTEEIVTQDIEETVAVESSPQEEVKTVEEEIIEEPEEEEEETREIQTKALFPGQSDNPSSEGEGETDNAGNQGSIDGSIHSKSHIGSGFGNGLKWSLKGRNAKSLPLPEDDFNEEGIVVVEVKVDQYGKVVAATPGVKGSNTLNSKLLKLAKEAALKARFNSDSNAMSFQRGTITYHFVLQ